ncbi:hypothetical protein ACHAPT_005977 [Fusarium lateritium]
MRSLVALAALALSGTANLAAAARCRPGSSAPSLASTNTATSLSPTQTGALPKVRNLASNGNMGEIDPEDPTAFPDWDPEGEAKIVGGQGRPEPGSNERGAAAMSASNTGSGKRDMGISVSISQTIANLDLTTPYTIRFYYLIVTSPQAINLCELTAYLGGAVFHQSWVFSTGMAVSWNEVLKSVRPEQVNAPLRIGMNCLMGGGATILVDSVFISNLVTPQNINNFAIDFGNEGSTGENPPLTPPAVGPTSSLVDESTSFPVSGPYTTSGFEEQGTSTWFTSGEEVTAVPTWFTSGPEEPQTSWFTSGPEEQSSWPTSGPEEPQTSWFTSGFEEASTWYTSGPEEQHTSQPEPSTWYTSGIEEASTWYTTGPEEQHTSQPEVSTWYTSGPEQVSTWYTSNVEEVSTWYTSGSEEQYTSVPEASTWYTTGVEEASTWYTSSPEEASTWYTTGPEEQRTSQPDVSTWYTSGVEEASTWYTTGPEEQQTPEPQVSTWYTSGPEEASTWYTSGPEEQHTSEPESYYTSYWTEPAMQSSPTAPDTTSSAPPTFCSKALNGGCWWKRPWSGEDMVNCASRGSWPGPDGQGWEVTTRPDNWPRPLSQLWCLGWCSLTPGCKSVAFNLQDMTCRFSKFEVQDSSFIHGPNPNLDTPGVYYWHDLSCFNCPCNEEDEPISTQEIPMTTVTPEPETTIEEPAPTMEPTGALKLPAASTCPKSLNKGCEWTNKQIGHAFCAYRGSWPGDDGAGWAVQQPKDYPTPWSQMWCVAWCSLYPGCKSAAWIPADRTCRFSTHEVQDADFIPAPDPNRDSEGVYYWHDLSCMTCACHDEPTTTFIRSTTTQPSLPGGEDETWIWLTPTPEAPVDEVCEWDWGQGICYRPFEKEQGPCGGTLKIVNPEQYTKLPYDWVPEVSEPVHCAMLCHTNPDCYAWGFEWSMHMNCVLSLDKRGVNDLQVVSSGPQYRWYDRDCWVCKDCITSWDWTWGSQSTAALEYTTTTEDPVYTTTSEPAATTCPGLDEADKLCQRTGTTGNCIGKVDFVNPANYRKVPMTRFPEQWDAEDVLTCAAICKANPDCQAFGWYNNIECVIATDQMSMDDLDWGVQSDQWYMWFNRDCFECGETCVNAQFEWKFDPVPTETARPSVLRM